ncbi:MAG: cation diffusion facilitator family transporter [Alphaproteobacteria bacterium]|nr:cation diffusion facilitator family transporter [Alphaproteobacteria bacterium]
MDHQVHENKSEAVQAGYLVLIVAGVLILVKAVAYYISGSLGVLSSLTDSALDFLVSFMALGSLYYARRPADEDHRWGHGKMEAVSALFQGAFLAGGAVFLVFEAADRIINPHAVLHHMVGIIVMVISIVLSLVIVFIQRMAVKRTHSLVLEADLLHYSSDTFINFGVIVLLALQAIGAPHWVDPVFAMGVAVFLGLCARKVSLKALDVLLDRELPEEVRGKIIAIIEENKQVLGWHDLRTYYNGHSNVISFDIEVDAKVSLWDAHEIAKQLERGVLEHYPRSEILIHIDPEGYTEDARHHVEGVHT